MNKDITLLKKQRGVYLLATMMLIISIILSMVTYLAYRGDDAYMDFYQSEDSRNQLMNQLREELELFYISYSNDLNKSQPSMSVTEETVLSQISIPSNASAKIRIGITDIRDNGKFQWRDIYAWIPATDGFDNSIFSPSGDASNSFSPGDGVAWTVFSGQAVEAKKFSEASKQVEYVANVIRSMFSAKVNGDPIRDQSANYFADCGPRPTYAENIHTLSCTGSSQLKSLSEVGASESLGLSNNDFVSPWGTQLRVSNETGSLTINNKSYTISSEQYPYNMIVTSETPSGYVIFKYVTQPL